LSLFFRLRGLSSFIVFLWGAMSFDAQAGFATQEWFASAQSRSMGMATTAIVDDFNSIYVNPAGLALVSEEGGELRLPQFANFGISANFFDLIDRLKELTSGGSSTISEQLQILNGTTAGLDFSILDAYWTKHRFGIAVNPFGVQSSIRIRTPSLLFAQADLFGVAQGGAAFAYGHPFMAGRLRIGFTWKPLIYRSGLRADLENDSIANVTDNFSDFAGTGLGMDFDLGMQFDMVTFQLTKGSRLQVTTGLAAQNLLATSFPIRLSAGSSTPPSMIRRYNFGIAGKLMNSGIIEPTLSFELRDLGTGFDEFLEIFHAALQFTIRPRSFYTTYMRAHLAKGNLGGGLGFKWSVFELEVGSYAENLGSGPGIGVDRRYYGQGTLSW